MAIQNRRGAYGDFDPSKMVPGEFAVVQSNDPSATDGKSVYLAFAAGDVKRLATHDDMVAEITDITEDIIEEVSTGIEAAIHDDMETASAAANTATQKAADATLASAANLAAAYSTSATYAVGDYCNKDGTLYRCTTAITTAESWTAAHWTAVKVGNEIGDLNSAIKNIEDESNSKIYGGVYALDPVVTEGYYVNSAGTLNSDANYVSTDYIPVIGCTKAKIKCSIFTGVSYVICKADKSVILYINGNNCADYGITASTEPQYVEMNMPSGAAYIRASQRSIFYTKPSDFDVTITAPGLDVIKMGKTPTVVSGYYVNGHGTLNESSDYVSTDYVDVSAFNSISIKCTIYTGVTLAFCDIDKNIVLAINGNNASTYDIEPNTKPQTIKMNLPTGTAFVRASQRSIYYSQPGDFEIELTMNDFRGVIVRNSEKISNLETRVNNPYVSVGTGKEYQSILAALKNTDDSTEIRVYAGTYDIIQEYTDYYGSTFWDNYAGYADSTDYFLRGLWLTNGRKMVFDSQAIVTFEYTGDNQNVLTYFSVFATGYNVTMDGLYVKYSRCRYAIHDDQGWGEGTNVFEHCIFDGTSAFGYAIGGGMGSNNTYVVRDCIFINNNGTRDVSYHNNGGSTAKNKLFVTDCYGEKDCVVMYLGTSTKKTYCMVSGCHFNSITKQAGTSGSTVDNIELIQWNNETN